MHNYLNRYKDNLLTITDSDSDNARIDTDVHEQPQDVRSSPQAPEFGRSKDIRLA